MGIWRRPTAGPQIEVRAGRTRGGSRPTRLTLAALRGGFFVAEFVGRVEDRLAVRPTAGLGDAGVRFSRGMDRMPSGKKRKRKKIATHKRKKRLRKNRHKKKNK